MFWKVSIILTLSLTLSGPAIGAATSATADVNFRTVYQRLDGFGAAGVHYTDWLTAHPRKNEIYNIIFGQLGLDIFRIENVYDQNGAAAKMSQWREIISAAQNSLGHPIKIMLTSGSPPAYLKNNGDTKGGTLAKDVNGLYRYGDFAKWWADSLASYSSNNINVEYVSVQNEPDYLNYTWNTCKFTASQTTQWAGYNQALEAVYQELNKRTAKIPKLLVPETIGFGGSPAYINALIDPNHIYGYAHHLYGDGDYHYPDSFIAGMQNFASGYGSRPILQTEFTCGDPCDFNTAIRLAVFIHNSLVYEGVTSYCYWDLFWGDTGGLVTIQFPWRTGAGFTINPAYYAFKQYTKFTEPGFSRVRASADSNDLRISAFREPHSGNIAIVIINVSGANDVNLTLSLNGFAPENSEIYRTSSTENFAYVGAFNESAPLLLPHNSISTIHLTGIPDLTDCDAVHSWGYGMSADINADCYVNYEDLRVLAERWLSSDCNAGNNYCDMADIDVSAKVDFTDFGIIGSFWMQCNNPQDANCTPIAF
jgi:glucuronoarabinoxylan endo-1,4-beta-xylanase